MDAKELALAIKKMSRIYGDDLKQAVARLAVATGRQLAIETQAFGANTRKQQEGAIEAGMKMSCHAMESAEHKKLAKDPSKAKGIVINSVSELDAKLETMRNGKGHVKKLPYGDKLLVTKTVYSQCLKLRKKRAGKAKGAWLGAGEKAAGKQKGTNKITIGKNFMSYAQKFAHRGYASFWGGLTSWRYGCTLMNSYPHSDLKRVLSNDSRHDAIQIASEKTLKWYKKANKENALK